MDWAKAYMARVRRARELYACWLKQVLFKSPGRRRKLWRDAWEHASADYPLAKRRMAGNASGAPREGRELLDTETAEALDRALAAIIVAKTRSETSPFLLQLAVDELVRLGADACRAPNGYPPPEPKP